MADSHQMIRQARILLEMVKNTPEFGALPHRIDEAIIAIKNLEALDENDPEVIVKVNEIMTNLSGKGQ